MKRFELLIFDWDGTLSDSAALIVGFMQAAIADLGLPPRDDTAIAQLIGLGLAEGMGLLYPELETPELLALLDRYRRSYGGERAEPALFAGALASLQGLHVAGYRMAVATGKSRRGLDRSLRHHGEVAALMSATRTADETRNKPDPLMLRQILDQLGVAPERSLMVGDTEYDASMARAIGMPMVGVDCGVHEAARMQGAGALGVIGSVADLPDWLARQGMA